MADFFSRLSYSLGNEDWETEQEALQIKPEDSVLCITASGDRPLNLLTKECRQIVAIDANPIQNQLLGLKKAALQALNFEQYLTFLGALPCSNRDEFFKQVSPFLSRHSLEFWKKNKKLIDKGVLYQGEVERLVKYSGLVFSVIMRKKNEKLFSIRSLNEQKEYVKNHWDNKWLRKTFEMALCPSVSKYIIRDPGLVNVGKSINPGAYLYQRMIDSLDQCLACENPLFSLIFTGKVMPEGYSPYLTQVGTSAIKKRLDRLTIHTGEIVSYLESFNEPTFDCFSFSDIASYMDHDHFVRLLRAMHKTAKPGARFCLRQFFSHQEIPADLQRLFERDHELEQKLEKEDRCFVYRFFVGTIK